MKIKYAVTSAAPSGDVGFYRTFNEKSDALTCKEKIDERVKKAGAQYIHSFYGYPTTVDDPNRALTGLTNNPVFTNE